MSDVSDLLVAIGTLVSTLAGAFVLVWTSVVQPRRQQRAAAKKAAGAATSALLDALADGELTPDEIAGLRRHFEEDQPGEGM